ncbi:MAG: diaminopimelate decarboxylase [Candidatus Paceibacteria bacterium]
MNINNVEVSDLVEQYGSPIFVYDEKQIRENYKKVTNAFSKYYPNFKIFYAIKANNNPNIARILTNEGSGIDASNANEIKLAHYIGVTGENIIFSGNFLSDEDIKIGLDAKVLFNLDDVSLLPRVLNFGTPEVLSFRINPGIGKSNVGYFDVTGGPEAKFGIHIDQAINAYKQAKESGIKRFGIHMMGGSCVTDPDYFSDITSRLFDLIGKIKKELDINFEFVDLGGGLGIAYLPDEVDLDLEKMVKGIAHTIENKCKEYNLETPRIFMEPGRYFVANAGYLIGKILSNKNSYQEIWGSDIGMNIVPRVVLYGAFHEVVVNDKEYLPAKPTKICGQICEQTDLWWNNLPLPELEIGDIIIMKNAGAYCYGMSYRYNGRLLPAEILVCQDGSTKIIRDAETFEDTLRGSYV